MLSPKRLKQKSEVKGLKKHTHQKPIKCCIQGTVFSGFSCQSATAGWDVEPCVVCVCMNTFQKGIWLSAVTLTPVGNVGRRLLFCGWCFLKCRIFPVDGGTDHFLLTAGSEVKLQLWMAEALPERRCSSIFSRIAP